MIKGTDSVSFKSDRRHKLLMLGNVNDLKRSEMVTKLIDDAYDKLLREYKDKGVLIDRPLLDAFTYVIQPGYVLDPLTGSQGKFIKYSQIVGSCYLKANHTINYDDIKPHDYLFNPFIIFIGPQPVYDIYDIIRSHMLKYDLSVINYETLNGVTNFDIKQQLFQESDGMEKIVGKSEIFLTITDLSERYRVSRMTIYRWVEKGLPHILTDHGHKLFRLREVQRWYNDYQSKKKKQ
jgi:hypothetical protein